MVLNKQINDVLLQSPYPVYHRPWRANSIRRGDCWLRWWLAVSVTCSTCNSTSIIFQWKHMLLKYTGYHFPQFLVWVSDQKKCEFTLSLCFTHLFWCALLTGEPLLGGTTEPSSTSEFMINSPSFSTTWHTLPRETSRYILTILLVLFQTGINRYQCFGIISEPSSFNSEANSLNDG